MQKNVAGQKIGAQLVSATDGSNFTGAVTVYVTGDAGTQAVGSVGAGACTHEGKGYHTYAPAQAETNYDLIAFTFEGTGAVTTTIQVFPSAPQTGDNYARLGAPAGASISADIAGVQADADNIQTRIPAALGSNGNIKADVRDWLGTAASPPTVAGVPNVNAKTWNDLATVALPLAPTTAGRTLDVSAGGEAGVDWANVGTPGSTVNLSATTVGALTGLTVPSNFSALSIDASGRIDVGKWLGTAVTLSGGVPVVSAAMPTVDGLVFEAWASAVLAIVGGKASVSGSTVTFKRQDGTTTVATVTVGSTPGERTASSVT